MDIFHRYTIALLITAAAGAEGQTFSTFAVFDATTGQQPSSLVQGTDGNFYGTTFGSPTATALNNGTVFKLTPVGTLSTLYTFCSQRPPCSDGTNPTGLTRGSDGNFYGVATDTTGGNGTIFQITAVGALTTMHSFNGTDGSAPTGNLVQATDGNFYGTTTNGGTNGTGTIFKISPSGAFSTIFSFGVLPPAGKNPAAGLIQATDGNFYGTTEYGGSGGNGTIFKVTASGTLTTLYSFSINEVAQPLSPLVQALDGNLYGTTSMGGSRGAGSVFKLSLSGNVTTLYSFGTAASDGSSPAAALVQALDGNLYGTTLNGGANQFGALFQITTTGTLKTLNSFDNTSGGPGQLILGTDRNIYGVAGLGSLKFGIVFRLQITVPFGYVCTNTAAPVITSVGSASSYGAYPYFASGSWLEIKGSNLADLADPRLSAFTNPGQWTANDFNAGIAPTNLDGISVSINGKPACVWFLSPTQLNVQAPQDSATGNTAVTVTNCKATSSPVMVARRTLAPGMLAPSNFTSGGRQYMVATFVSDGAYVLNTNAGAALGVTSRPAKPGDLIVAYGVGFGDVTPSILPGSVVTQSNTLVSPVTVSFGSADATLSYSGLAGGFVGLYQFFITVPQVADGDYLINVAQGGTAVPQTMYLTVRN